MAARKGDATKAAVIAALQKEFPDCFLSDKKLIINGIENGEKVQVSVALACPKTIIEGASNAAAPASGHDWSSPVPPSAPAGPVELSAEDSAVVKQLREMLGI